MLVWYVMDHSNRSLEEKFALNLPEYPGFAQIVELPRVEPSDAQKL